MNFLSKDFFSRIKHMELRVRQLVTSDLQGEYLSGFKGSGMEFDRVREWSYGDDIRQIDWNVTARMNSPFVKIYHENRELTMMVALDVSQSLFFGSKNQSWKIEKATEIAAMLAFLATKNQDKVGLLLFTDQEELYLPPKKGSKQVWHIIKTLGSFEPKGKKTDYEVLWQTLSKRFHKRRALCFVISDFLGSSSKEVFSTMNRFYDLSCIRIQDPLEQNLAQLGLCRFQDLETQETVLSKMNALTRESFFKKNGISSLDIQTHQDVFSSMTDFLKYRHKRVAL